MGVEGRLVWGRVVGVNGICSAWCRRKLWGDIGCKVETGKFHKKQFLKCLFQVHLYFIGYIFLMNLRIKSVYCNIVYIVYNIWYC